MKRHGRREHSRHLQGRLEERLQQRPRPGPGRRRLGGRGPQGRLLEQGAPSRSPAGRPPPSWARPVSRSRSLFVDFGRRRHLPRQVPRGHDPQGRRPANARRLSPAQGRVPHARVPADYPRVQGRRRRSSGRSRRSPAPRPR
ncbi:MAG: hypothetical protein M0C28_45410 [Candidatus Moduliflexus flocculans]|nr:hypothetical protein [Candidatus Moduliflexus flocculans]